MHGGFDLDGGRHGAFPAHTVASFETHMHRWKQKREDRQNPQHQHYRKQMPKMVPPSYVRLFQITLSQTHSSKFKEHFGAASIDGTLHTPFQLMAGSDDQVAGSADQVAESAAIATRFQVRLFNEDTRMAIDSKTSFLDSDAAMELVTQVRNYKGTKLWLFVMDRVQKMVAEERGSYVSPFQVRLGYEQILGTAFKTHWLHKQDFKESIEDLTVCGGSKRPRATAATAVSRPEKQQKTKVPLWKKQQQQQEQQQRPPAPSTRVTLVPRLQARLLRPPPRLRPPPPGLRPPLGPRPPSGPPPPHLLARCGLPQPVVMMIPRPPSHPPTREQRVTQVVEERTRRTARSIGASPLRHAACESGAILRASPYSVSRSLDKILADHEECEVQPRHGRRRRSRSCQPVGDIHRAFHRNSPAEIVCEVKLRATTLRRRSRSPCRRRPTQNRGPISLPGNHEAAYDIWLNRKVQALHPEMMWERLVLRH